MTDPQLVQQEFVKFFVALLGKAAETLQGIDITIVRDGPCLSIEQQQHLMKPVTATDVMMALKELPVDKSPRIDGFNAEFFKTH